MTREKGEGGEKWADREKDLKRDPIFVSETASLIPYNSVYLQVFLYVLEVHY